MKTVLTFLLALACVGCGYSSKPTTPPTPGTTPTIAQLVPPSTAAGSSQFSLEVDGTNFNSNAVVNFNGTAMTTMWTSSTKITATIPASAVATSGTVPVKVTNPGTSGGLYGGGTTTVSSAPMNFTIN